MSTQQDDASPRISPDPSSNFIASDEVTDTSMMVEPPGEKGKGKAKVVGECKNRYSSTRSHIRILPMANCMFMQIPSVPRRPEQAIYSASLLSLSTTSSRISDR